MNLSFFFARRYLFSKKSRNAVNVITLVTLLGFAVGTAALVIVLSVFNGFEKLVISLYNSFDSDVQITASKGKVFSPTANVFDVVRHSEGLAYYTEILEENVLVKYGDKQNIATLKAVSSNYKQASGLDTMMSEGILILNDTLPFACVGSGIAARLDVNVSDQFQPMEVFVPRRKTEISYTNPEGAFNHERVYPTGIFAIQQELDEKFVVVPIAFARKLLEYNREVSSIEIRLKKGFSSKQAANKIRELLGPDYMVKDRFMQHAALYKLMKSEKWSVFLILVFILFIVSLNLIGALIMLVIEKKHDFSVLNAIGSPSNLMVKIIRNEGMLITLGGSLLGLMLGLSACLSQQYFGWLKLGGGTFVISAYPVDVQPLDVLYVFLSALIIGWLSSYYPSRLVLRYAEKPTRAE